MANKVYNMDGGLHSSAALGGLEDAMYGSSVANSTSFVVTAGTGMSVSISTGNGLISTGTGFARRIATDAANTVAITAASTANPRIDSIVAYIDNSVTPVQTVLNNTNDILKFAAVAGSPAASPVAPSAGAIQTAVGAGNPYMVLYNITVPANATSLTAATFTDMRNIANEISDADIADGSISVQKINWGTMDSTETGWKYLGEARLTVTGNTLDFILPSQKYYNYHILAAAALATGSSVDTTIKFMNGNSDIPSTVQVTQIADTTPFYGVNATATEQVNGNASQYDGVNIEILTMKTVSSEWRKFHSRFEAVGAACMQRTFNGRCNSNTEPTKFRLQTGGTFVDGAWIKVWASNPQ